MLARPTLKLRLTRAGDVVLCAWWGLYVGILARDRVHRTFRRLTGSRLELLLAEAGGTGSSAAAEPPPGEPASPDGGSTEE